MNGFFTDNQTKQKAYDRYYNAMAKSDFVQGAKLQAKLREQGLDDASSESLAKLFQQVIGQAREYDYDKLMKKTKIAPPPVIEGKKKAYTFTPTQTDRGYRAQPTPIPDENEDMGNSEEEEEKAAPKPSSKKFNFPYERVLNDKSFNQEMYDILHRNLPMGEDMEEAVHDRVFNYLKSRSQKERKNLFNNKRHLSKEEYEEAATKITKILLKRKRADRAVNEPSPNLRPTSRVKQERERAMSGIDLNNAQSPPEEQKFTPAAKRLVDDLEEYIDNYIRDNAGSRLRSDLNREYNKKFDRLMGQTSYFKRFAPAPPHNAGFSEDQRKARMEEYKKQLKKWIRSELKNK